MNLLRHTCECCGKEEVLTPEQAYDQGWDHPPKIGKFRIISPRTCGDCGITGTLWAALNMKGIKPENLDKKHLETLNRIMQEPDSLKLTH